MKYTINILPGIGQYAKEDGKLDHEGINLLKLFIDNNQIEIFEK